jgi:aspartate racemase
MYRKIGILGGMSPESTSTYYEEITRTYTERYGDYGYPEILIYSVNFQKFVEWQRQGDWQPAAQEMARCLQSLKRAGADFGLIATNTMHIVFREVQAAVDMPLLSIVEATASSIVESCLKKVGLLGTIFTMREAFYRDGLSRHGIDVLVPPVDDQDRMNRVIFDELCRGEIRSASRDIFLQIIQALAEAGAEGIVLGCTEIPLLVHPGDTPLPLFNTTVLHARMALDYAIKRA